MKPSMPLSLVIVLLASVFGTAKAQELEVEYQNITKTLSIKEFERIKNFILANGDRQTYCMKVGNNPHYSIDGLEFYLHPELGQQNMSCDPAVSDFNELVIRDTSAMPQYQHILIMRKGDPENAQITLKHQEGMREGKVYVVQYDDEYDLKTSVKNVKSYLQIMDAEMNGH